MKKYAFLAVFFSLSLAVSAQQVQWASTVLGFSSQVHEKKNGSIQILGSPSALPQGGQNLGSWKPTNKTNKEYIKVGFARPMQIKQVLLAETYRVGGVTKVFLYDTKGQEHEIAIPEYPKLQYYPGIKNCMLPELTPYSVSGVKLIVDNENNYGMEIDAIGVSSSADPVKIEVNQFKYDLKQVVMEPLGPAINSKYSELLPVISPDGKSLYFSRRDDPTNAGKTGADDVYLSTLQPNGTWGPAKNIGPPINNYSYNSPLSISPDGNTIWLMNIYFPDGRMAPGLSHSRKTKNGWSYPEGNVIDNFYNDNDYNEFCISHSGKVLISTLERKDSKGSKDLYVSFKKSNGNWSEPLWMGPLINSPDSESSPFLAADEKTLYFSTKGLPGFGNNDIYMTKRLDDSWTKWSEPVNLGNAVNSNSWDAFFTIPASGEYAYMVSRVNSVGAEDIVRIKLPKELKPEPVALIQGTVFNAKTKQPITANITYERLPQGENAGIAATDPATNQYKIILPAGSSYGFLAEAPGFLGVNEFLDLKNIDVYKEVTKDLYLVPIEVGQVVRMNNLFFETKKSELRPESFPELNRIQQFLVNNPKITIEISGHTDNVGTDADNQTLSEKRAQSVMNYLLGKKIPANRISAKGYGKTKFLASNDTEEGRQKNRRVEFTILKVN